MIVEKANCPLISIIIPCYNRENLLQQSLNSVIDLAYRPIQIIIIDDGSTDDSWQTIQKFKYKYQADDCQIIIERQKNRGACAARNRGLELAFGDFIQFLDSDDLLKKDKLTTQVDYLQNRDVDIVVCDYERASLTGQSKVYSNQNPYKKVLFGGSLSVFTPLFKSKIAKAVRWDETLKKNQDADYILKSFILTDEIGYVKGSYCVYFEHDQGRIRDRYQSVTNTFLQRIKNVFIFYQQNYHLINRFVVHHLLIVTFSLLLKEAKFRIKQSIRKLKRNYTEYAR